MKILSKSKMREVIPLPLGKDGKKREAVFNKDESTEISDEDYKYLCGDGISMVPFLVDEGTFIVQAKSEQEDAEPSKLDKQVAALQAEKEKKGDKFHHKTEKKLQKLLVEQKEATEDAKTRQGK